VYQELFLDGGRLIVDHELFLGDGRLIVYLELLLYGGRLVVDLELLLHSGRLIVNLELLLHSRVHEGVLTGQGGKQLVIYGLQALSQCLHELSVLCVGELCMRVVPVRDDEAGQGGGRVRRGGTCIGS